MREPGWDEPTDAPAPAPAPTHTGTVEAAAPGPVPTGPVPTGPVPTGLVPTGPVDAWPPYPVRNGRVWRPTRGDLLRALAVLVGLALAGALVALAWYQLAPRLGFRITEPGTGVPVTPEQEQFVAADGWFTLLTLGVGVLAGVLVWLVRPFRGPVALLALAAGGMLGAVVTWRFGALIAPGPTAAELRHVGQVVYPALRLRATAALVVEPIAAVAAYLLLTGFASRTDLGRPDPDRPPRALATW
jgi:hypothetical protein